LAVPTRPGAVDRVQERGEPRRLAAGPAHGDPVLPLLEVAQLALAAEPVAAGQDVGCERVVIAGLAPPGRIPDLGPVALPVFVHPRVRLGAGQDEEALARHPPARRAFAAQALDELHGLARRLGS